ncbi:MULTISPECIES: TetR/AcrR family transcriptional regulator [unclassified Streptomyces]|uniref:TetR/AcrR family transcriptional regulator n=1 Tax=unclassified Streptomyces TaxID=2593676 RepID=UPI0036F566D3
MEQQRRDEAEAALLRAAAERVVEQGMRALTLARVGERAGYGRGMVTYRFGSEQALVERLARAGQAGFVSGLADLPPGLDRLLRLIDGYIARLGTMGVLNRAFLLLWAEAPMSPEPAPVFRARSADFRADLCEDLAAGIADGTIRSDAAPEETAIAIMGQPRGLALQRFLDPEVVDPERLRRPVTEQWRRAPARSQSRPRPWTCEEHACNRRRERPCDRTHGATASASWQRP